MSGGAVAQEIICPATIAPASFAQQVED